MNKLNNIPKSVPSHIAKLNPSLWTLPEKNINWQDLDLQNNYIISGSAFIDLDDSYGAMGNPFAVIIGNKVKDINKDDRSKIVKKTGTPETVFINEYSFVKKNSGKNFYKLNVTVYTPSHKELGACAHGFTGAIQTLLDFGLILPYSEVAIETTLSTSAEVSISADGVIALHFTAEKPQEKEILGDELKSIFGVSLFSSAKKLPVLSVGSPKMIIELPQDVFMNVQKNLGMLDYDALLAFEKKNQINGIHLFCRNSKNNLPEKAIQVNAYLGKENMIDPATGVSAAPQISKDDYVKENQEVKITQYALNGPSAVLMVTKRVGNSVEVGGTAKLFNYLSF
jgi:predicted PhzF superfamily epimerase YddE/YHI9